MSQPTIENIDPLGKVISEDIQIVNNVFTVTRPFGKTNQTVNINFLGKRRIITLQVVFVGSQAAQNVFVQDMEGWVNSNTQDGRVYTDSYSNQYTMLCLDFTHKRLADAPGRMLYSLLMIEGSLVSAFT